MTRFLVESFGDVDQFGPVGHRLEIDFDDARVRRDLEDLNAVVIRRRIALDADGEAQFLSGLLDGGNQVEVVLDVGGRGHEDVEHAVAGLRADGGADDIAVGLAGGDDGVIAGADQLAVDDPLAVPFRNGEGGAAFGGILFDDLDGVGGSGPGKRFERQAVAHGRVAGDEQEPLGAELPLTGEPRAAGAIRGAQDGKGVPDNRIETALEDLRQPGAILIILDLGVEG